MKAGGVRIPADTEELVVLGSSDGGPTEAQGRSARDGGLSAGQDHQLETHQSEDVIERRSWVILAALRPPRTWCRCDCEGPRRTHRRLGDSKVRLVFFARIPLILRTFVV